MTLALMQKCMKKDIVRPRITKFATCFYLLSSLREKKENLIAMLNSLESVNMKFTMDARRKAKVANAIVISSYPSHFGIV